MATVTRAWSYEAQSQHCGDMNLTSSPETEGRPAPTGSRLLPDVLPGGQSPGATQGLQLGFPLRVRASRCLHLSDALGLLSAS